MQNGGSSAYSYMTLGKIIEFFKPPLPHLQCPNYLMWLFPIQNGNEAI